MTSSKHPAARYVIRGVEHRAAVSKIKFLRKGDLIVTGILEESETYLKVSRIEHLALPNGKPDGEIVVLNEHGSEILRGLYTRDVLIFRPV